MERLACEGDDFIPPKIMVRDYGLLNSGVVSLDRQVAFNNAPMFHQFGREDRAELVRMLDIRPEHYPLRSCCKHFC